MTQPTDRTSKVVIDDGALHATAVYEQSRAGQPAPAHPAGPTFTPAAKQRAWALIKSV